MFLSPKMRLLVSLSAIAFGLASSSSCATSQAPQQTPNQASAKTTTNSTTKALAATPAAASTRTASDAKILLTPQMVTNESALGDASQLVDEQQLVGDPLNGKGEAPKTSWTAGWTEWQYPIHAFIDLGAPYKVSSVCLYDTTGTGDVTISAGQPFKWKPLFTDNQNSYMSWDKHPTDVETRYLRVSIKTRMLAMPEIVVYGHALGKPAATPKKLAIRSPLQPTMDNFVGINAFIDDPFDLMSVAGFIREYHPHSWDEATPDGRLMAWAPSPAGGGAWNFDSYYGELKKRGITVSPCIQQSPQMFGGNDNKPIATGADGEDPRSYALHAGHLFQFAARYGSNRVLDSRMKLAANQKRVSGLGFLHYFENWNEPDKNWRGREGYFTPYEMAAMGSADRDGHKGLLGKDSGIKNADPNAQLVMAGLAGLQIDYLKAMKVWSDWNRGGQFPYDVINVHHYSNFNGNQFEGLAKNGVSPEQDKLRDKVRAIVEWRNQNVPGAEVWLTEFGYDVNQGSPQHAPQIGSYSPDEVQAQWLVRSYFEVAAAGADRAAMYMLRDVDPKDATQFSSSGLTTQKGEWAKRPSWYYVYTLKNRLRGMRFAGEVNSGNAKVKIYRFKSDKGGHVAYAVWCPTSDGGAIEYSMKLSPLLRSAKLVQLQNGQINGAESSLPLLKGVAKFSVSERPVFVLADELQ